MRRLSLVVMLAAFVTLLPRAAVASVELGPELEKLDLGAHMDYRREPDAAWQPVGGTPSFGFTHDVYWFRVQLVNRSAGPRDLVLEVSYPLLDYLEWHVDGQVTRTGDRTPYDTRGVAHRHFLRVLRFAPGETKEVRLRVQTSGSLQVPLTVWSRSAFEAKDHRNQIGLGLYYGLMIVMALYNLFVFLAVRDRDYLYYVLYVGCFALFYACMDGVAMQHLWPDAPAWNNLAVPLLMAGATTFAPLFTRRFCEVPRYLPRLDRIVLVQLWAMPFVFLAALVLPYNASVRIATFTACTGVALCVLCGFAAWRVGVRQARYYVLAWAAFFVGTALFGLSKYGLIPRSFLGESGQQIGSVLEVILISFALADRINFMKKRVEAQTDELEAKNRILQQQAADLAAADKQKTTFFQNVSHELRTPLTLILNPLEDMASEERYRADRRLGVASQNARRLLRLVNQLLDFQKIEAGKKQLHLSPINLVAFLRSSGAYFGPACDAKGVRFRIVVGGKVVADDAEAEPVWVKGEVDALEKVIFNFLSNALKFTPDGGAIDLMCAVEGGRVRVSVADNGPGIAPDDQRKLFQVFSQADGSATRRYEGTGLGLALARELATAMGGEVGVSSRVGEGSTFWALFPQLDPAERPLVEPRTADDAYAFKAWHLADSSTSRDSDLEEDDLSQLEKDIADGVPVPVPVESSRDVSQPMSIEDVVAEKMGVKPELVLVVDDLPDMRNLVKGTLEREGLRVLTAANGERALELAHRNKPDLIVTDWMMPVMTGPDLIRELKSDPEFFTTPIVLLTARSDEESRLLGTQMGADGFLGKPFNDRELTSLVKNLLKLKSREKRVEELNRHLAENVLKRYLPPTLVDAILDGRISINQQPRSCAATILFCDLVSFTQAASKLRAAKMARVLNDYLGAMTNIIFEHGGTIDKFIGDAVMVIFGAPMEAPPRQQIEKAVACALAMQEAMDRLNESWKLQGIDPLAMRVGIHHGAVVVGNFGDTRRYDYTAIGPAVNAAVSLEKACEPGEVFVSGEVYDHLPEAAARPAGDYHIKGVDGPLSCFRLVRGGRRAVTADLAGVAAGATTLH